MELSSINDPGTFCERCGVELTAPGRHPGCQTALELEPPRYCRHCARRMVVQVTPNGWKAECARHGTRVTLSRS